MSRVALALEPVLSDGRALVAAALVLAASAAILPRARAQGAWAIAVLGAAQIAVIGLADPSAPWVPLALGTWLLCGVLAWKRGR